ncbi:MAG: hypothetical protein JSR66_24310 [Proteobacteria bacterium]|nr:hypothetical protein [Pseudomonadota bacterium]
MNIRARVLSSWLISVLVIALVITPHRANAQWSYTQNVSTLTDLHQQSRVGPAVTVDNTGRVYLAWSGTNGPQSGQAYLNIAYSSDGINFSSAMNPLSSTDWSISPTGPGIAVLNGNIYYAWTGGSNHINIAYAPVGTTLSGAFTSHKSLVTAGGAVQQAAGSVSLTVNNGTLYLAWAGVGNNLINYATSTNGTSWAKTTYASYTSPYSPGLAAASTGAVYLAWTSNNQCQYLNALGPIAPKNCSGTLPGHTYTYAPVVGSTGPGIVFFNGGIQSFFGACPYAPCNSLFHTSVNPGSNAYQSYEMFTPAGSPNTLGVSGNPAILHRNTQMLIYFTQGTEIEVATIPG